MQPNQDQYPIDYLNNIAPKPEPKKLSPWVMLGAIIGGLVIMGIIAAIMMSSNKPPDVKTQLFALNSRINTLTKLSKNYHNKLRSDNIRGANSNITGYLSAMTANLVEPTKILTGGKTGKTGGVIAEEKKAEEEFKKKIDEALLNGNADRAYAREMIFQLETLKLGVNKVAKQAKSKSFSKFQEESDPNIDNAIKQLEDFEASF